MPFSTVLRTIMLAAMALPSLATARPLVIAHRGASGERPEHTRASYALAIAQGADFIEPDLVATKDGVLVARHENEISETTDVAAHPEFAGRRTSKTIDGRTVSGWFTEDFTVAELKTLRARERLPQLRPGNLAWGDETIPTLDEVIALAKAHGVGIYPETKHPSYFRSIGLPLEPPLLAALDKAGWTTSDAPVFVQSFEVANLKMLRGHTKVRLIQLVEATGAPADGGAASYAAMLTPAGLAAIAGYADGIGPAKSLVIPRDGGGRSLAPTTLVADAHAAGLAVHPWTFRAENQFLPAELRRGVDAGAHGDLAAEIRAFVAAGVDGVFADYPGVAREVVGR